MIDIHTHLLPGVDDGSPSVEVSVPVLRAFGESGVEVVVCTPHLKATAASVAPYDRHVEILELLRTRAPATPRLTLGWEIMLDMPGVALTDRRLGLGGSTAVLVEFPRTGVPPNAAKELFRLRMSGVVPVLAHPERYWGCTPALVEEWRRVGTVIQVDAAGLLGVAAQGRSSIVMALLERGLVDLFASDTHGDDRSLAAPRKWLEEVASAEAAQLLTHINAGRLLSSEAVLPVPPVVRRRGVKSRLRELLFGR